MNKLPKARNENVVVQQSGDEIMIYDLLIDKAYCLNDTLSKVFNSCDGKQSFDDLKRRYKFTDDLIHFSLAELKAHNLLVNYETDHFKGISRREVIRRVGLSSMFALPLIASVAIPQAAQAASCVRLNGFCSVPSSNASPSTECCSTVCSTSNTCCVSGFSLNRPPNASLGCGTIGTCASDGRDACCSGSARTTNEAGCDTGLVLCRCN